MIGRLPLIASLLVCVTSYRHFADRIPNGDAVPHPCKPNNIWEGVGHFLDVGTGARNPFGEDFEHEGEQWTGTLCKKDSDGDGLTNGEELGDPNCKWKPGDIPERLTGLSHPGICDPWDSPNCFKKNVSHPVYTTQEKWMREMCKADEFVCAGLSEPGLKNMSVRIPPTAVPARETNYECQIYDLQALGLPSGQDFHMIAVEPIISNTYVLHHMVLFGCTDDTQATGPFECGMLASDKCQEFLSVWTVGMAGDCYHPNTGIRFGQNGIKKIAIQLHWNNPEKRTDHVDSSGLLLHYTSKLRTYDAGMLMTGTDYFYLPPHQEEVVVHSRCAPGCTRQDMLGPIHITMAWNHMHYAGVSMNIELRRNNTHITYLTDDPRYSYDSPQLYLYTENPVTVFPGDDIRTTCTYTTVKHSETIFYGWATHDEMCFGFLTYYPKQNQTQPMCLDTLGHSYCEENSLGECNITQFVRDNLPHSQIYKDIQEKCRVFTPCLYECVEILTDYWRNDPCMEEGTNYWEFVQSRFLVWDDNGREMLARISSCQTELYQALHPHRPEASNESDNGNSSDEGILMTQPVVCLVMLMATLSVILSRRV